MDPKIAPNTITEEGDILRFTLSGVNTSIANSVRRTILSDIPCVVFKTYNEDVNTCVITRNTTAFNNEIIKQRLGCVPIHISDMEIPIKNYQLEVNVENTSDTIQYVTTKDFRIKNTDTGDYLTENDKQKVFPPNDQTGQYIDFLRLRPKVSDEIPGEAIDLTCAFSVGNAKENGMYNVVSCCSYGCSLDEPRQETELNKKRKEWKDAGYNASRINDESKNWKLLDGLRIIKKESFDFLVESIGIYTNQEIVHLACDSLIQRMKEVESLAKNNKLVISPSVNTMENSYDITLKNEDYTIGKALEYVLYTKYYETQDLLSFCGFKKVHPHDTDSIIRVAYENAIDVATICGHVEECARDLVQIYEKIKKII